MLTLYLAWCASAGIAPSTIRLRRGYLARIPNLDQASTDDLVLWLGGHDWAPGTRANAVGIVQAYYAWLRRHGHRADDPAEALTKPRIPPATPRPAPDTAVDDAMLIGSDRDRLMVGLGAWAGLRRAEIAAIRWDHIVAGMIIVRGKGGRTRSVPVAPELGRLLDAERRRRLAGTYGTGWRLPPDAGSGYLFPSPTGRGHLSPPTVYRVVRRALGGTWSTHTLRHRFGTLTYTGSGHDLFAVMTWLGHASPVTTQRYVQVDATTTTAALAAAVAGFSHRRPEQQLHGGQDLSVGDHGRVPAGVGDAAGDRGRVRVAEPGLGGQLPGMLNRPL